MLRATLSLLLLGALTGCAEWSTTARVLQPASLDVSRYGTSVGVRVDGCCSCDASAQLRTELADLVAAGLNPSLHLAGTGAVTLSATVLADEYNVDVVSYAEAMSIPGVAYPSRYTAPVVGTARSRIRFAVLGPDQRELAAVTLGDTVRGAPSRTMLPELRTRLVDQFRSSVEPTAVPVRVEFAQCAGDPRCRRGFEAADHGRYVAAERWFARVVDDPSSVRRGALADALYDRGLSHAFGGDPDGALPELDHALGLYRGRVPAEWQRARALVAWMRRARRRLIAQGVGPQPATTLALQREP